MKIYIRKIFPHDITHEISVTTEIVKDYFDNQNRLSFIGKNSKQKGIVTINAATDPRFGGDIKTLVEKEGGIETDDLLVVEKKSSEYLLEVIKKTDYRYKVFFDMFLGKERHIVFSVDETESNDDESVYNHNVFGIHIKNNNNALSDENPHICIGWSKMGDLSECKTKEDIELLHSNIFPDSKAKSRGQDVGQIYRFLIEAKIGDYVVYGDGSTAHIGRIESDYYYCDNPENQDPDYVNNRKVKWLKSVPYSDLSLQFKRSLSSAMSFFRLNDYKSVISELLNDTYQKDDDWIQDEELEEPSDIFSGFRSWLTSYNNPDYHGTEQYSGYPRCLERLIEYMFENSLIEDNDLDELNPEKYEKYLEVYESSEETKEFDKVKLQSKAGSAALKKYILYIKFLIDNDLSEINYITGYNCAKPRNRIIFGAPGTGKSFTLNKGKDDLIGENNNSDYERVTFHPDYSYANFVGTYKPVSDNNSEIKYAYVPGPFMRIYVKAMKNAQDTNSSGKPFLLLIEEINRANVAAVFGDIFQLLDRAENNISEYPVQTTEDMRKYLAEELGGNPEKYNTIRIPDNMFIWATMNSADQGVFPMDTAFKRRWNFTYCGINSGEEKISGKTVELGKGEYLRTVDLNELRKAINDELLEYSINEDKLMGPFFISKLPENNQGEIDKEKFIDIFKNKVLMYLFDDAAKQKRPTLFSGSSKPKLYSAICNDFDEKGISIFCDNIKNLFLPSSEL